MPCWGKKKREMTRAELYRLFQLAPQMEMEFFPSQITARIATNSDSISAGVPTVMRKPSP